MDAVAENGGERAIFHQRLSLTDSGNLGIYRHLHTLSSSPAVPDPPRRLQLHHSDGLIITPGVNFMFYNQFTPGQLMMMMMMMMVKEASKIEQLKVLGLVS